MTNTESYYKNFAPYTAILAGLSGLAYAYFFLVARNITYSSLFLMLSGLLSFILAPVLYDRLKEYQLTYSKVAAGLLAVGSLGALIHGGYDLANAINPVES